MNESTTTPKTELMLVTPAMAKLWLENNTVNRNVRKHSVAKHISRLRNGEWKTTHQGIAFASSGRLIDGQHRLLAILESGVSALMNVSTGFDEDTFDVLDCGDTRSAADRAKLDRRLVQVTRLAMVLCYGGRYDTDLAANNRRMADIGIQSAHEALVEQTTNTAVYACASMRLALCVMIMDGGPFFYIHSLYQNLTRKRFGDLPPIASEFVHQVETRGKTWAYSDESGLMARALKVFDPKQANKNRLVVGVTEREEATRYITNFIRPRYEAKLAAEGKAAPGRAS